MQKKNILNFAVLSVPLAFVGLPIYINVSDFYIRNFDINIGYLAIIILFVRLIDGFQEPILGLFSDYLIKKNFSHKQIIYLSSGFLALSFFGLFNPPFGLSQNQILLWIFIAMTTTYSFYNLCLINFEALAVVIAKDSSQRVEVNSYKEFFGLIGIIIASASPQIIRLFITDNGSNYFFLSIIFILILFISIIFFFRKVPENQKIIIDKMSDKTDENFLKSNIIYYPDNLF